MDAALRDLLTTDVAHAPRIGSDLYDAPIYGAARPLKARVVEEAREIRTRDNRLVVRRGYMILGEEAADLRERDQLVLDGFAGEPVEILAVSKPRDLDQAVHHVRAEFL